MGFSDDLRQARLAKGWSLRELSERIGVSTAHLSNLETGKSIPSPKLADLLGKLLKFNSASDSPQTNSAATSLSSKSAAMRRMKEFLITRMFRNTLADGKPQEEAGWVDLEELDKDFPGGLARAAVEGLLRLGDAEADPAGKNRARVVLDANLRDERIKAVSDFIAYRKTLQDDDTRSKSFEQYVSSKISQLTSTENWREAAMFLGVTLALQRSHPRCPAEWFAAPLISMEEYSRHENRVLSSVARRAVACCYPNHKDFLGRTAELIRSLGSLEVSIEQAPSEFSQIIEKAFEYWGLSDICNSTGRDELGVLAICWVLWTCAEESGISPTTEESGMVAWKKVLLTLATETWRGRTAAKQKEPTRTPKLREPEEAVLLDPKSLRTAHEKADKENLDAIGDVLCFPWEFL
jgi:transcriptional regulator with XRE-family HTH domain